MKIISIFLFLISLKVTIANEIEVSIILENCKSCHGQNYEGNKHIKSLKRLETEEFISIMNEYLSSNDNHVMARISKVLNKKDIMKMAEKIYEKVQ